MTKLKKTARELAEMIAVRMTSRGVRLNVLRGAVGWHVVVYGGAPCHAAKAQAEVDQIVQRLRANYTWTIAASEGLAHQVVEAVPLHRWGCGPWEQWSG